MRPLADLPKLAFTRRSLVTAAAGFSVGIVAGGGLAVADGFMTSPTLTIIGQGAAQFTMVRTESAKFGLLFGTPSKDLLAAVGPMLGWTSPRLDALVISPPALTMQTNEWLAHSAPIRSLLVLGPNVAGQMPALRPGIPAQVLVQPATIGLGPDVRLELYPSFSTAAIYGSDDSTPAMALIRPGPHAIAVVDDAAAVQQQPWQGRLALVVVPTGEVRPVVATMRPGAIAINGSEYHADQVIPGDLAPAGAQLAVLQTYLTDLAVIELASDRLQLPSWTKIIGPASQR